MRIRSSIESFDKGEATLLAIFETALAVSITALISVYYDTYIHIVVSASLAPFLLLRTDDSTDKSIKYFTVFTNKIADKVIKNSDTKNIRFVLLVGLPVFLIIGIYLLAIKISVVMLNLVRSPINTIGSIPKNWYRVAFFLDTSHPPEPIPGWESSREKAFKKYNLEDPNISWTDLEFSDLKEPAHLFLSIMAAFIFFLPSILYRYSLKSTSIIYLKFCTFPIVLIH